MAVAPSHLGSQIQQKHPPGSPVALMLAGWIGRSYNTSGGMAMGMESITGWASKDMSAFINLGSSSSLIRWHAPGIHSDGTRRNALGGKENDLNSSMNKCTGPSPVNPSTETKISTSILSLSGGLSNGPSQSLASVAKYSQATCHFPPSDSKGLADLKDTPEEVVLDLGSHVNHSSYQALGVGSSVSDPLLAPPLQAHSHGGEIVASNHAVRSGEQVNIRWFPMMHQHFRKWPGPQPQEGEKTNGWCKTEFVLVCWLLLNVMSGGVDHQFWGQGHD